MLAALVGAQQGIGLTAPTKALYIDGLDVLYQPGTPGALYGVPIETIQLTEAGPGQVSSMSFTIEDPNGVISLQAGGFVRFHDITRDLPLFTGFLETFAPEAPGTIRQIAVTCVGIEAVLDWMIVPSLTIADGTNSFSAIRAAVAAAIGVGVPIKTAGVDAEAYLAGGGNTGDASRQAYPVAGLVPIGSGGNTTVHAVTVTSQTLRQAIQSILDNNLSNYVGWTGAFAHMPIAATLSVDFYGGLRTTFLYYDGTNGYADYPGLTVSSAGPLYPTATEHTTNAGSAVRQVVVTGGNAAGSGTFTDGTGLPGLVATISDTSLLTRDAAFAAAQAYINANGSSIAGSVTLDGVTNIGSQGAENRAGGQVTVTDTALGISGYKTNIAQIDKTFLPSGSEVWTLTYGTTAIGSQFLRRLTRAVLG